ncbi:hypothetical protein C0Q70_05000 [Pomacea canaliculata]|uniref:Ionotropic glutamate receptor C-terminal domain-containing protein n=1 Tax=Pomacea canaliculata TaxID=400727 RepID=A0A2T7PK05_POMCA|nr:hypothetical protein C0Q70_05000 [Pomacea canaliculata]
MSRLELGLALDVVGLMRHVLWRGAGNCVKPPLGSDHLITAHDFARFFKEKTLTYEGALGEYVWERGDNARTNYTMDVLAFKGDFKKIGSVGFENSSLVVHLHVNDGKKIAPKRIFSDVLRIVTKQQGNNYTGFAYDLLVALATKLNFRFELFDITDRDTGGDGTYGALVRELTAGVSTSVVILPSIQQNASMAVGALEVTAQRETVISFSYTILSTQATILVRKPKNTQNFFQFLSPFKTGLWMMILAFIAVAALALFLISRFDPTQQGVQQKFDLKESVWYALNILLQGSTEYSPQTTSMRAIIAFFWFSVLIIDAAYTANLAAYLTLQQIDSRIKTIHDLSRQTQIKYGMENGSSLMHFIQTQKEDPFERMWAFMRINEEKSLLSNTTTIIENVKSGRFIFIADGVTNGYYAKLYCGIESIEQNFGAKDFALGFPRGAQYKDDINRGLLQLKESGVLDDLKHKWWTAGRNCTDDDDTMSSSEKTTAELNITNMVGVFIVLAAFTVLAIIVDISLRIYGETRDKEEKKSAAVDEVPQKQAEEFT